MKKVILSLAFVLATGSSAVNASTFNESNITIKKVSIEKFQDDGRAGDCVRFAKNIVSAYA